MLEGHSVYEYIATALGVLFAGLNISVIFFFKTDSYAEAYEPKIDKFTEALKSEHHKKMNELVDELVASRSKAKDIQTNQERLWNITKIGVEAENWSEYLEKGKDHLRRAAAYTFFTGVVAAVSIVIAYPGSELAKDWVIPSALLTFLFFVAAISNLQEYTKKCTRMDTAMTKLKAGRPIDEIIPDEEDDEE